jgi:hypothetical protein
MPLPDRQLNLLKPSTRHLPWISIAMQSTGGFVDTFQPFF